MTHNFKLIGGLTPVKNGLVDCIGEGYIIRGDEMIPCEIGYRVYDMNENGCGVVPTHIFIQNGITENGTHYNAETIEL